MFDHIFVNPIYWVLAIAVVLCWARFAMFVSEDVKAFRTPQAEILWRSVVLGAFFLLIVVWMIVPFFWIALPLDLVIFAGVFFWYDTTRVANLKIHVFNALFQKVQSHNTKSNIKKAAQGVALGYLRKDDSPVQLPMPEDPAYEGIAMADDMMIKATEYRADTVELTPTAATYDMRFYVDGFAYPQAPRARTEIDPIIQAMKFFANVSVEERRKPQEGIFKVRDQEGTVTRWTLRTSGTNAGERLSLSANDNIRWTLKVDQLGMTPDQLAVVKGLANDTLGAVIVATPRQAGRTATLYALLRQHDAFTNSVATLETNPQAEIEGITATKYDARSNDATFTKVLMTLLRKDPSVFMSSQIPDAAAADALARYAADEHRVYLGIQAFDTVTALEQWLQMAPDRKTALACVRCIIAQRLVRMLCPTCKLEYQPDEPTLRKLNLPVGRNLQSFKANIEGVLDEKGQRVPCPECNNVGYSGRTGIFEVLVLTDDIRKRILEGASMADVKAMARKNNMTLLIEHGIRKFASGITSINEVLRVLQPEKPSGASGASGVMQSQ
jgi:type II secretory ATPase GspE/PulE/Tfp pilus assembly ATPase PilB-like protein